MARVMRAFQERWRFRHPSSADFFAVASEVAGRDLAHDVAPDRYGEELVGLQHAAQDARGLRRRLTAP